MRFTEILWRQQYPEKIIHEHQVELDEVEEVLSNNPFVRCRSVAADGVKISTLCTDKLRQGAIYRRIRH